ncbi:MAG: hypothetical protein IT445_20725 [Phycisphaeraceae bacterium]|nr:hypothetical protein [Phycisphaeraceae bacterium]
MAKTRWLSAAAALSLAVGAGSVAAQVSETFDSYADGSNISGQAGDTGWSDAWSSDADGSFTAESGSLTYAGYKADATGSKAHLSPAGTQTATWTIFRNITTPFSGDDTFYISFLAQNLAYVPDASFGETNPILGTRYFGVGIFGQPEGGGTVTERFLVGQGSGFSQWTLNRVDDTAYPGVTANTLESGIATSGVSLVVCRVDLHSGPDLPVFTFWVNPDVTAGEFAGNAVGGQSFVSQAGFDHATVSRVRLGGGGTQTGSPNVYASDHYLDEVRIGFDSPFAHPGDANGDGLVNLSDLQILGDNWQSTSATWATADFTWDSIVNLGDLQILGDNWGWGTTPDVSFDQALALVDFVPEPASFALIGLVGLLLLRRPVL